MSGQWLYMSPYFERHKDDYLDLLFAVSAKATWEEWIEFCLRGVVHQANDALRRLHREYHRRLESGSVRLSRIVDNLLNIHD